MKPLAVDLCCGLGGWTHGLLSAGWDVVGFDIERHIYGNDRYPAQLVLQDIRTIDGRQFRGKVSLITASPPCTEFSYCAMPWSRAKQIGRALRGEDEFPAGYKGSRTIAEMTELFDACVRIGREAECPIVIENVRGAQPWVGQARWNYGSFYLYGDVPALMPMTKAVLKFNPDGTEHPPGSWFAIADSKNRGARAGQKVPGFRFDGSGRSFQSASVAQNKVRVCDCGHSENDHEGGSDALCSRCSCINPVYVREGQKGIPHTPRSHWTNPAESDGVKQYKSGRVWFSDPDSISGSTGSRSSARKAASAMIARIPFNLAYHIAKTYYPSARR